MSSLTHLIFLLSLEKKHFVFTYVSPGLPMIAMTHRKTVCIIQVRQRPVFGGRQRGQGRALRRYMCIYFINIIIKSITGIHIKITNIGFML